MAEDTPSEDTPTEDTPTEDTPSEDTPSEDTPTPVESDSEIENGCPGVPVAIPDSCRTAYNCAEIKEIFEYTEIRVDAHNERRRRHKDTPDVTSNLDIAC